MKTTEEIRQEAAATYNRGGTYHEKKEYDLAIKEFTEAIRLDPTNALAYFKRGNVYIDKNEYDLAIKDYSEAIRLNPNLACAYNNRGYVYAKKKEYDLAIGDCTEAVRLDPEYKRAHDSTEINAADDIIRHDYTDEELRELVAKSLEGIEEEFEMIFKRTLDDRSSK